MRKPKSKLKQLAGQKRAAKRNKRDIRIRREAPKRRAIVDLENELNKHKDKMWLEKLDAAKANFQETNGEA